MKSLFPLISVSLALSGASALAAPPITPPPRVTNPTPGNCRKVTRVDFHENNGWGNGDQNAPGNSGPHNNAENGTGNAPPPGNPGGNNGWGNGDQSAPGNSGPTNNAENGPKSPTPNSTTSSSSTTTAATTSTTTATNIVARRVK